MTRWRGVVAVEGVVTEDGRLIEPTAIRWDGPIPLTRAWTQDDEPNTSPLIGYVESVERREREPYGALIYAEGTLLDTERLPDRLDLSATLTGVQIAGEGVDHPQAFTRGDLRGVTVGGEKVWDECVLEVIEDAEE
ncbi:hypothetical protein PBI_SMARTIES_83 [Microbacterium phage Smarties]|uniref:Uncharacterized protein n=1 Tax=Microbacterium phage Ariadne TaxID=2656546 RepID=A0A649VAY7_9CAUD|nr:hypothetical protein QDA10_gp083 [Microbacterium phage Ariadne]QGJ89486.1 hypothetical protein PBI_ARIADNE_83 [Microbacterium phage Ariadne]QGJ91473.1 hypothetical protein PBI_SMARTIES_83 [Microbacterium phage Smarties]